MSHAAQVERLEVCPTGIGSSARLDSVSRRASSSPARSSRASGLPPVAVAICAAAAGSIGSGNADCRRLAAASDVQARQVEHGDAGGPVGEARLVAAGEHQCGRLGLEPAGDEA